MPGKDGDRRFVILLSNDASLYNDTLYRIYIHTLYVKHFRERCRQDSHIKKCKEISAM